MAGVLRFCVLRMGSKAPAALLSGAELPLSAGQQKCNISGKSMRGSQTLLKTKPYPYKTKGYNFFNALFDKTTHRFTENSKIICVDGPVASGKSKFAKELADELEMLYVPEANMDLIYINDYGYNMRQLDPQLPASYQSYDHKNFCQNPSSVLASTFQIRMYMLRYEQYIDALAHLFSTGQGVVLDRSCYSDFVFLETMVKNNYISKGVRSVYYDLRHNTITELMKPHLVIYLDVPAKKVMENIKKRGNDYEVNSKVFTEKYLTDMEHVYKQQYLNEISTHAEMMVYDWSNGGETEVVVEDIERINFERFDAYDPKMKDWRMPHEWDFCEKRMLYASNKGALWNYFNVPRFDVPEVVRDAEDAKRYNEIWWNAPGMTYSYGYNSDMGDKGLLTKIGLK